jgi:Uma2 family endonuclease
MAVTEKLFTAEDIARLPGPREGGKMELVAGRVVVSPPPFADHGMAQGKIYGPIDAFVTKHDLGAALTETGFKISTNPDTVRAPDVAFISWARMPERRVPHGFIPGRPDLAVEVKSSDDTEPEVLAKVAEYLEAGTSRVWVARPQQRTIAVHYTDGSVRVFHEGEVLSSSEAGFDVDGFQLAVSQVFALV